MTRVVGEVVDAARPLARDAGLTLTADLGDIPLLVTGDSVLLHRVGYILIENALKYTPAGGQVQVRLRQEGVAIVLDVSDSGIGIAAEDLPRVFDRFWRADKARSRGAGGTGLGLSIARDIVGRAGGTLTAESTPGVGSTFRVTLPLAREAADETLREP